MSERRSLVEGLKAVPPVDPTLERSFVYDGKRPKAEEPAPPVAREGRGDNVTRVPLTSRVRTDFARALKRASLERQLAGQYPNTVQDILEEALDAWLRANNYLT